MIGIVLVTHGAIGTALRDAMEHVVGPQRQVSVLPIGAEDDIQSRRRELEAVVDAVDTGDGVILLTDMFGGTPSNLAVSMMGRNAGDPGRIEVIAGVNLPMLVKLGKVRSSRTLAECTALAETVGRKYIAAASTLPEACLGGAACCASSSGTPADPAAKEPDERRRVLAG